ncbi:hypothetical protein [Bradyrhizobium sp. Tv2a-2]|uniref:hypothetical protein n=1 Tax=Bradyrhizobium sp. Tv2a-2 TaxID=113395 RepID=UPI0012EBFAEC|nr:hypothetical protein [Bradyrhizobium sp. Tv2a-2]
MLSVKKIESPHLAAAGLDGDLSEEELAFQANVRRFALQVMRPAAQENLREALRLSLVGVQLRLVWSPARAFGSIWTSTGDLVSGQAN